MIFECPAATPPQDPWPGYSHLLIYWAQAPPGPGRQRHRASCTRRPGDLQMFGSILDRVLRRHFVVSYSIVDVFFCEFPFAPSPCNTSILDDLTMDSPVLQLRKGIVSILFGYSFRHLFLSICCLDLGSILGPVRLDFACFSAFASSRVLLGDSVLHFGTLFEPF